MADHASPNPGPAELSTVRDRLWLWCHDVGSHNEGWGLPGPSRIMPADAADYLGIPNLIMVRYRGRPPLPLHQYAESLRGLRRVVWSAVGAHGETNEHERAHVLDLAARHGNVTGIILDDFFGEPVDRTALSLEQLRELREQLSVGGRRLDLWAVLYEHQLEQQLSPYLQLMDVLSLWAWDAEKLQSLNGTLERAEALAPGCRKALGCYLWDYAKKRSMPLEHLQELCESGLMWLRQGRIEGMIFLASCLCDLGLEAVEWTRGWIAKVWDEAL